MTSWNPIIIAHTGAAAFALLTGLLMFSRKKGTLSHQIIGRVWAVCLLFAALSAFWIQSNGHFSWIHLFSIITPIALLRAVLAAKRGNVRAHRIGMISLFCNSLIIAGLFTLHPDRLIGHALWTSVRAASY